MTHLHISVPAITRGTLARTHELKIRPIVKLMRNSKETRVPEMLTYVLATLQDIRTSFCALVRGRTIYKWFRRVRGPAAKQATCDTEICL